MKSFGQIIKRIFRIFLVIYLLAIHVFAALFIYQKFVARYIYPDNSLFPDVRVQTEETPVPTPLAVPSIVEENANAIDNVNAGSETNLNANANQISNQNVSPFPAPAGALMVPVAGIKREQLTDTFSASRSGGRVHDAIDIMAPAGTPVIAAADGEIAKFFDSKLGGITIYQYSADKKYVYYYAHLQKRADNLKEKDFVRQGTLIGYVGDTGNAGTGNYHLHFSISTPADPSRYFEGPYLNPFPLLKNGVEAR
jgi:murein DD-endopeptidase MepM/ murein hydrolase activator NlpD